MRGIKQHRGYEIRLHDDALTDLAGIQANDPKIAARLRIFLQEYLEDDPDQRLNLAVEGFQNEVMQVGKWSQMWQAGYQILRIKLQGRLPSLGPRGKQQVFLRHRIPYVFDDINHIIWILGIFERKDEKKDYDTSTVLGRRIQRAFRDLGLSFFH